MTDSSALYTAAGAVVVALVALIGNIIQRGGMKRDVGQIRDQVKNDHGTNLRHDIDQILAHVGYVDARLERLDGKLDRLDAGWLRNRRDIDDLIETTEQTRRRRNREAEDR